MHIWGAWNRRRQERRFEARLRSSRPTPRDEFVLNLSSRIGTHRSPRVWSRVAFAGAVATLLVGTFASFGGVGYAGSGATQVVNTLKTLSTKHKIHVDSSASAQYKNTPAPPTQAVKPAAQTQVAGAAAAESGALPFTGLSLLGTVLASIALIGIGLVLRRRERSES